MSSGIMIMIYLVLRAGVTIAMGNASDNLKAKAMYVTDTNDNDGIGKALIALAGCIQFDGGLQ